MMAGDGVRRITGDRLSEVRRRQEDMALVLDPDLKVGRPSTSSTGVQKEA